MEIQKRTKDTDISSEVAQGKFLRKRIMKLAEEVTDKYTTTGKRLSEIIASIAQVENFNRLQIQRLVEESNTSVFNALYKELAKQGLDRRVEFELADLNDVIEVMGDKAPPEVNNPNWVKGKPGEGEIAKTASEKPVNAIHTPNSNVEELREKLATQQKEQDIAKMEKIAAETSKELESGIFKIANCIVLSEHYYKNGNKLFNTVLNKVAFNDAVADGIVKKAEEITNILKESRRIPGNFMLSLKVDVEEKVASTLFGKHSLLKTANQNNLSETPKVAPITGISDIDQLISAAMKVQQSQNKVMDIEKKLHGGA